MKIGELFVNLGIKGDAKSANAAGRVSKGLGEVKEAGLGAKAAVAAAIFGLERLMASSTASGTSLLNFSSITGLSAKRLQQWQWAAMQAGVDGDALRNSVESVQKSMTNMALGKGAPEGLGLVSDMVGFDMSRAQDTFYVLEQLQKFAQSARADVANTVLSGFGLGSNVIAAMRRNAFRPEVFDQAPTYSDSQIGRLNKADAAWRGLGHKIKMAMGEFSADKGLKLVQDLSKVTDQVLTLTKAFADLADELKIFEGISKAFEGWGLIFGGLTDAAKLVKEGFNNPSSTAKDMAAWLSGMSPEAYGAIGGAGSVIQQNAREKIPQSSSTRNNNATFNQSFNFSATDPASPAAIASEAKRATRDAFRQMSAQGQEN